MTLETSRLLVADEMRRVDELIRHSLASDVVLINQLGNYIIESGGKRLRPQLVLMSAGACGYAGEHHIRLAAIIEFIHTATLLHDDVVDASELRRGRDTANALFGNEAAVLVGDFLYSRAFEMMVDIDSMAVMAILASTTNRIAEGEVMQLMNVREPDLTEDQYIQVIEAKTARLFEAATELGAVLAGNAPTQQEALATYGRCLGTAFQIIDDVLDYQSDAEAMGKNVGDDLAEGKTTLPLIYAMRDGSRSQSQVITEAITEEGLDALPAVMEVINDTEALDKSILRAQQASSEAITALVSLPPSPYKDALIAVAQHAAMRTK
ncbi:MAG: polyprenyl synthetase family protein [Gammaproteobacteria bacterium]|nr:polyprenyl synthetase family protein [Gammaproteobacteria bacterium]